ncbi:hypothetical protein GCM10010193_48380 [Kitasatospora atroaurantiaca]|uniref:oligosaccharide flippase family protein n=1 Tax=Kitasatospora atroaurantiaca TaxID=285545 RepID=UPI0014792C5A|nr:oligosaccharide flippase family protein [Kitasatospora atroaurantiaca]
MSVGTASPEARTSFRALLWNYSAAVAGVLLQLCYTAYTARVVSPRHFGDYAAASASLAALGNIADAGLFTYLLRAEHLTRQTVRTAYRVAAVSGALCFATTQAVASLCANVWGLPEIEPTVRLFGLLFLTEPLLYASTAALRRMDLARFASFTETGALLVGMAVGSALLAAGWSPYGLVAARIVTTVVTLGIAGLRLARCPLPVGPRVPARSMVGVSGAFAGYRVIQILATNVPMYAVTRVLGPTATGQYSRASLVVGLPMGTLCHRLRCSVMPSLARINGEGRTLGNALPDLLSAASAIAFVSFGVLAAVGPAALRLLLGPGWGTAGELMTVFAAGAPLVLLCQVGYTVDEVRKAMGALLQTQLLVVAITAGVVALGVAAGRSLALVAAAYSAASAVGHLAQLVRWHRARLCHLPSLVRPYLIHAAVGGALYVSGSLAARWGDGPLSQIMHGLLGMAPVALVCVAARRRLPFYSTAVARGLVTQ